MTVFFHYLQSDKATLYAAGELVRRELDTDYLVSRTISHPPNDLFHTYVLNDTAMTQLSHAEDVFMAKEGITLEDVETIAERMAVDDRFIAARLQSPANARFGFEVHSDNGKHIRAIVVEAQGSPNIKTLLDAASVMVTAYDAVVGDDGQIKYAEVYPAAIKIKPALFAAPMTTEDMLGLPTTELPVEFVQFKFKYKQKPVTGSAVQEVVAKPRPLPGLGGGALKPDALKPGRGFDLLGSASAASRGLPSAMTSKDRMVDFDAAQLGQMYMDRFNEALMLLHVMGREPAVVQQQTEAPSGKIRAGDSRGKRSGVHRIDIDPVEFRVLVSKRAQHIRRIFENPEKQGYGDYGLHFVKRHPRKLPSGGETEVSPYAKCDDEAVQIRATALVQALEKYTLEGNEAMKIQISLELAREVEQRGAAQTKARFAKALVNRVNVAEPVRNPLPEPDPKADRAP